mgnify:CR=1 FL=1
MNEAFDSNDEIVVTGSRRIERLVRKSHDLSEVTLARRSKADAVLAARNGDATPASAKHTLQRKHRAAIATAGIERVDTAEISEIAG